MEVKAFLSSKDSQIKKKFPEINNYLKRVKNVDRKNRKLYVSNHGKERNKIVNFKNNTEVSCVMKSFKDGSLTYEQMLPIKPNKSFSPNKLSYFNRFESEHIPITESYLNELEYMSQHDQENPLYKELKRMLKKENSKSIGSPETQKKINLKVTLVKPKNSEKEKLDFKEQLINNSEEENQIKITPSKEKNNSIENEVGEDFLNNGSLEIIQDKTEESEENIKFKDLQLEFANNENIDIIDIPNLSKLNENYSLILEDLKPKSSNNTENTTKLETKIDEYIMQNSQYFRHLSGTCACFAEDSISRCSFSKPTLNYPDIALRSNYQKDYKKSSDSQITSSNKINFKEKYSFNDVKVDNEFNNYKHLRTTTQSDFRSPTISDYVSKFSKSIEIPNNPSLIKGSSYNVSIEFILVSVFGFFQM